MLLHGRGANVLRLKGVVNMPGLAGPEVINGGQHIHHLPLLLDYRPVGRRRARRRAHAQAPRARAFIPAITLSTFGPLLDELTTHRAVGGLHMRAPLEWSGVQPPFSRCRERYGPE